MMPDLYLQKISFDRWTVLWQRVSRATLLQSWEYGTAKEETEGWRALRYAFIDSSGKPVALVQVLTKCIPFFGGIARVNRGPVFLNEREVDGYEGSVHSALRALLKEARKKRWWVFQMAPELPDSDPARLALKALGFRPLYRPAWASGLIDLAPDEESILMGFHGKWRNCMRKGIRSGVNVSHHAGESEKIEDLICAYGGLQRKNEFHGIAGSMLRSLARQQGPDWRFHLLLAHAENGSPDDEPIGMLVTISHGDTTTYLIGLSNEKGKRLQANSVLLWAGIKRAKCEGGRYFDIGGLSEETPEGIARFKRGLKAKPYTLAGEWRWRRF